MSIFIINFVWGFSAVLMFIAFFGVMLGICTYMVALAALELLVSMTVVFIKNTACYLIAKGKQFTHYLQDKLSFFKKKATDIMSPKLLTFVPS